MTHVHLIQHIAIHSCGSSSTARSVVNACSAKQLWVLQLPAFAASAVQPTNALRAASVLKHIVVTCQDLPAHHPCLVRPSLEQPTQPGKQKPFLGRKSHCLYNDVSAFTLQCLTVCSVWALTPGRLKISFIQGKNAKQK